MKKLLLLISACICMVAKINAQTYPSLNITLLSHIDPETDNTGSDGRKYSGCWGWYQAAKNKEYAIVGTSKKTYFIDVTNPSNPVVNDSVMAKHTGCTWREIKTYQNYCYMVSDQCHPNSLQIVDMQYLPDSVHVVHDSNTLFELAHTVFVDKDKLYCGSVTEAGGSYSTMRVYSLANPEAPLLLRKLEQDVNSSVIDVVHDMFVRNDTIYASCGYKGLHILKLTAANTFSLMQSYTGYQFNGYNHSSWQTNDRKTMVFADEVPAGLPIKVIDVQDFSNINLLKTINSHSLATPHNPYIVGNNWCWVSSYQDGIYLYDISDPANTSIHGYFDTYPQHGDNDNFSTSAYRGNWGAYPFLPSKIIIACDMQNGMFILDGDNAYKSTVDNSPQTVHEQQGVSSLFSVYPNPANNELSLLIANQQSKSLQVVVTDVLGKVVEEKTMEIKETLYKTTLNTGNLNNGCYFVTLKGSTIHETKKILIQR